MMQYDGFGWVLADGDDAAIVLAHADLGELIASSPSYKEWENGMIVQEEDGYEFLSVQESVYNTAIQAARTASNTAASQLSYADELEVAVCPF